MRGDQSTVVSDSYGVVVKRSLRSGLAVFGLIAYLPLSITASSSVATASTRPSCHVPRMTGLTVLAARSRARVAGCALRLTGARVQMPSIQTIHTQSVRPGQVAREVTISVNPLCAGSINPGPPPGEPILKPGPSELISGLFIEGGAFIERSAPHCKTLVGKSNAGTITITNSVGTVFANNMALTSGQLLYVNVPAGQYTISGVFAGGNKVGPVTVTVPAGEIVRQDLVLDVP
jgi:hypothetical protein